MDKLYLGIDQSFTYTGMCVVNQDKTIIDCNVSSSSKDDDIFTRANFMATQVGWMVKKYEPSKIIIEGLAYGMTGNSTRDLAGLQFVIVCHLKMLRYEPIIVSPKTIKMHALNVLKVDDDIIKMKDMKKKQNMYKALPQTTKDELEPYKFLKTKGLYDVTDAWWLATSQINK